MLSEHLQIEKWASKFILNQWYNENQDQNLFVFFWVNVLFIFLHNILKFTSSERLSDSTKYFSKCKVKKYNPTRTLAKAINNNEIKNIQLH